MAEQRINQNEEDSLKVQNRHVGVNVSKRVGRPASVAAVVMLAAVVVGWGSTSESSASSAAKPISSTVSGTISMDGVWSGAELSAFQDVINTFHQRYPNVTVNFRSTGDNTPTVLAKAVAAGHPPDLADIAQPGLIKQFANRGALKPETYALVVVQRELRPGLGEARHDQRQVVRGRVQGVEQVDRLV